MERAVDRRSIGAIIPAYREEKHIGRFDERLLLRIDPIPNELGETVVRQPACIELILQRAISFMK